MARKPIPPPRSAKSILMYGVPITLVGSLLISSVIAVTLQPLKPWQTVWGELLPYFLGVFASSMVFVAIMLYLARPQYFYDEKGIYRKSQLLSDWQGITTLNMSSAPGRMEQLGPPIPNLRTYSAAENDEFLPQERVDTSKYFFSFVGKSGKEIARVPTRLSAFSIDGVSQDLIDTANRAGVDLAVA